MCFFVFNDTATTEIYTLSLHDALPIFGRLQLRAVGRQEDEADPLGDGEALRPVPARVVEHQDDVAFAPGADLPRERSEEHTSELQSRQYLVCRLLLEKKNIHFLCTLLC